MNPKTPPLGWNTWNTFGGKIDEQLILESTDKFIELGLKDAGYEYIVIDDCWSLRERDAKTGEIVPDPEKFPHGMKFIADYIHSKGLKFGMYSCAGVRTCADFPGSFDHEFLDARTFARWEVDFLKYDYCDMPFQGQAEFYYRRMGQALRLSGRDILFSACNWGSEDVWRWVRSTGAGMYRSTGDIFDTFGSMREIASSQLPKFDTSGPGCFNDMDMLTVGMYRRGNVGRGDAPQTFDDYKLQFAAWCVWGSPLMLGCDIRSIDAETLALVKNKELLAINQDPLALQPFSAQSSWPDTQTPRAVARLLEGGDLALLIANFHDEGDLWGRLHLERLGLPYSSGFKVKMRDVFTGEETFSGRDEIQYGLKPHACKVWRCTPVPA